MEEGVESEIRAQFDANVFGLFALTRAVLPAMRKARSGHVINITSVAGLIGFASSGYYSASKHAVEGWSDSLALEAGPLGIRVTCVEPGPFPHRFGRTLPASDAEHAARLCRDCSRTDESHRRIQRYSEGRSGAGRHCDDCHHSA